MADLVLYEWVADANLKLSVKIKKEFSLKNILTKTKLSVLIISINFKTLQLLNKSVVCELSDAKFMILIVFLREQIFCVVDILKDPMLCIH